MADENSGLAKKIAINNAIATVVIAVMLAAAYGAVAGIDAVTGYGMGFEIILVPIVGALLVFLGNKLLIPVYRFLWASVLGPVVLVMVLSALTHFHPWGFQWDFFGLAVAAASILSALMYVGLRMRVNRGH